MLLGLYLAFYGALEINIGQIVVKMPKKGHSTALSTLVTAPAGPHTPMDLTHVSNACFVKKCQLHGAWGGSWGQQGRQRPQIVTESGHFQPPDLRGPTLTSNFDFFPFLFFHILSHWVLSGVIYFTSPRRTN